MTEKIHRLFWQMEREPTELVEDRTQTDFSTLVANFQKIFPTAKARREFITDCAVELFRREPELISHTGRRAVFSSVVVSWGNPQVDRSDTIFLMRYSEQTSIFKHFREPPL